ncbi:MAG: hypothetical protein ABSB40_13505 [Nitrososphaeria archaeon]|jgi:hypothetical protein
MVNKFKNKNLIHYRETGEERNMKYEYKVSVFVTPDLIELENLLDDRGKQGWKLITVQDSKYIFIRELSCK